MASRSHTNLLASRKSSFLNQHLAPAQPDVFYVGVDVGTGSARACIIDTNGIIVGLAERPITRHQLKPNYITQSSTEIWNAICFCVRTCLRDSGVDPSHVYGMGFDATCSLVAISEDTDEPVAVGPDFEDNKENIMLWMDHRAENETMAINATDDKCLKYVGGQMSIEMELPKIKWLKHNMPGGISGLKFYDLPDYLTHKATGSEARSFCSAICKQGFMPLGVEGSTTGWSKEFLEELDLPELVEDNFRRLGGVPGKNGIYLSAGDIVGKLSVTAAEELGLTTDCVVGSAVIDAYAGWIGTVAAKADIPELIEQEKNDKSIVDTIASGCGRLAAVAGTSTCHLAMTKDPCFVQGVWGPYKDVMAPGYWLAEGGQSCTGALLAHVLAIHPAHNELAHQADESNVSKFDYLNMILENLVSLTGTRSVVSLAKHLFYYGDFHGNRSPIADPHMRASIIGQSMDSSINDLAVQYFGACEFIAQQTRQIVEEMTKGGHKISCVFMSGGQCRNGLLMRLLADCTGLPIVIPRYIDAAVVFGTALLGAVAAENEVAKAVSGSRRRQSKANLGFGSQANLSLIQEPHSPYTAPTATASTTNMSTLVYPPNLLTNAPTDYFNQPTHPLKEVVEDGSSSDEDEQTLSFGSQKTTQQDVQKKMGALNLRGQPSDSASGVKENPGDKLWRIMQKMTGPGKVILPSDINHPDRKLLNAKYQVFLEQCFRQQEYRKLVDDVEQESSKAAA